MLLIHFSRVGGGGHCGVAFPTAVHQEPARSRSHPGFLVGLSVGHVYFFSSWSLLRQERGRGEVDVLPTQEQTKAWGKVGRGREDRWEMKARNAGRDTDDANGMIGT